MLRRYQALAQVQAAESRLISTLGLEPRLGSVDEMNIGQIVEQLKTQGSSITELLK
jgi:protein gp37